MKFTAIDFETANASMLSACSIGVVEFEDNVPVKETITLIRPPEEYGKFNWYNVRIHGIKKNMVKDASNNGYWAGTAIAITSNTMYKNMFELDPAKQAF